MAHEESEAAVEVLVEVEEELEEVVVEEEAVWEFDLLVVVLKIAMF